MAPFPRGLDHVGSPTAYLVVALLPGEDQSELALHLLPVAWFMVLVIGFFLFSNCYF